MISSNLARRNSSHFLVTLVSGVEILNILGMLSFSIGLPKLVVHPMPSAAYSRLRSILGREKTRFVDVGVGETLDYLVITALP